MNTHPIEPSELLKLLWGRRRLLFVCGVLGCALSVGVLKTFPTRYESDGLLMVEHLSDHIPELDAGPPPAEPPNIRDHSVIDMLKSRLMIETVVRSLNPDLEELSTGPRLPSVVEPLWAEAKRRLMDVARNLGMIGPPPAAKAAADSKVEDCVEYLQKHIVMDSGEGSRIVSLRFESTTPVLAANVLNSLMNTFINSDVSRRKNILAQASTWVTERVAQLRQEVMDADQQVEEYRRKQSLFRIQAGPLQSVQLAADQDELAKARRDLSAKEAALATLSNPADGDAASHEALASPVIQGLREREADLLQKLAVAAQHIGPATQDKSVVEQELRTVRQQIDVGNKLIHASIARDVIIAREHVNSLEKAVDTSLRRAADAAVAETTLAGLERDAEVKRQTYNQFVIRADHLHFAFTAMPSVRIVSPAYMPVRSEPKHALLIAMLASLGSILLASAYCLARHGLDDTVRSIGDLVSLTGLPTFGSLPKIAGDVQIAAKEDSSQMAETLRAMRVRLLANGSSETGTSVLITSSDVGEGKTTIAAALGQRLAADGVRVLLIETDFRRPKLSSVLNMSKEKCIEDLLARGGPMGGVVQVDLATGLHCLVASGRARGPRPLFNIEKLEALIKLAKQSYQLVLLDSPPVLRVADPILLAKSSDLILFIVRANQARMGLVKEALRRLSDAGTHTVFLALNYVKHQNFDPRDYYGGYGPGRRSEIPLLSSSSAFK